MEYKMKHPKPLLILHHGKKAQNEIREYAFEFQGVICSVSTPTNECRSVQMCLCTRIA